MFTIEMHMYSYITSSNTFWKVAKEKAKISSKIQIVLKMWKQQLKKILPILTSIWKALESVLMHK